jgi:ABC-type transporter Mla maintaining outer membrane lipid asymmetry ATPase subunit MlaF
MSTNFSSNSGPLALDLRDVVVGSLRNPGRVMAEAICWQVRGGEFWVVAGLHGAGKSDLLMLAGGVMAPLAGEYDFLGERMPIFSEERMEHRLKLGLVFDGGRLFNGLTVAENIALPLRYHRNLSPAEVEPHVGALLELLELTPFADARPGSIGRTWQRRVALARALALQPEVLLLDNPLTGLDQRQQNWWLNFLGQLSRGHAWYRGRPITLVVTADGLRDWRGAAQRFALLEESRLRVLGDWAAVEQSEDPLVRELIGHGVANV